MDSDPRPPMPPPDAAAHGRRRRLLLRWPATAAGAAIVSALLVVTGLFLIDDHRKHLGLMLGRADTAMERAYSDILTPLQSINTFFAAAVMVAARDGPGDSLSWVTPGTLDTLRVGHVAVTDHHGAILAAAGLPMTAVERIPVPAAAGMTRLHVSAVLAGPLPWLRRIDLVRGIVIEDGQPLYLFASIDPTLFSDGLQAAVLPHSTFILRNQEGEALMVVADAGATVGEAAQVAEAAVTGRPGQRQVEISDARHGLQLVQVIDVKAITAAWLRDRLVVAAAALLAGGLILWGGRRIDRQAADALFRGITDAVPNGLVEVDGGGRILYANPALRRFRAGDGPLPDLRGAALDGLFAAEHRDLVRQMVRGRVAQPVTVRLQQLDGGWLEMDVGGADLPPAAVGLGADGGGRIFSLTDVTAREGALRARAAALDAAREASAAKSRLMAAASHDLRQPVQVVTLMADRLAKRDLPPATVKEVALDIRQAARVMTDFISAIMDYSRLTAGIMEVHRRDVDLVPMLHEATASARAGCEKPLDFALRTPAALVAETDPLLFRRIVQNLLSNAVKYTAAGTITVSAEAGPDGRPLVRVSDTGIGIASDLQGRVFDEFFQVDNPARDFSRGFGLGLTIVRQAVDLLGHDLDLQSAPGRGTTITIRL
ncbi:PAS domain-containing sensor histidine kinase [Caenispirillum bisanense]|uniref:PAS domain-containing sensor histidine kinase n=1 Tax=Caenispirillum bisanense TaxID=414052 RepID=UPI0031DB9A0D